MYLCTLENSTPNENGERIGEVIISFYERQNGCRLRSSRDWKRSRQIWAYKN